MIDEGDDFRRFDVELSDREIFFVGKITALWGALEHEVFTQTLVTFDSADAENIVLPKEMNNLQFTAVLLLWKTRVVDEAEGERAEVLQQQYDKILQLHEYRNALVHGMWDWSRAEPAQISIVRVRKKEIIRTYFTADDLADFCDRLRGINFKIRYPGGLEDLALKRTEHGFYISRRGVSLLTGDPVADDWIPFTPIPKDESGSP